METVTTDSLATQVRNEFSDFRYVASLSLLSPLLIVHSENQPLVRSQYATSYRRDTDGSLVTTIRRCVSGPARPELTSHSAAFLTQTVKLDETSMIKFEIWDTAGQER